MQSLKHKVGVGRERTRVGRGGGGGRLMTSGKIHF